MVIGGFHRFLAVFALVALPLRSARGDTSIAGHVHADLDGNGALSPADAPLAGLTVVWETTVFALTDADGRFELTIPRSGILWVRVPEGFRPSPVWARVTEGTPRDDVELLLTPTGTQGAARFIVASDAHVGVVSAAAVGAAVEQATSGDPPPHFYTITGDLTQNATEEQFAALLAELEQVDVPFVPVPGNHDWYDGGGSYRAHFGPPNYSFDAGGVHFAVLTEMYSKEVMIAFLTRDLETVPSDRPVVVLTHFPPGLAGKPGAEGDAMLLAALAELGVDYLFTGHWHTNEVIEHDEGFVEYITQPLAMAGIDLTPAGYRQVALVGNALEVSHHTVVERDVFQMLYPDPFDCAPTGEIELIAAVEVGAHESEVTLSMADSRVQLGALGGWGFGASAAFSDPGVHELTLTRAAGERAADRIQASFCVEERAPVEHTLADWPQLQRDASHTGARAQPLLPPLAVRWASHVGGHLLGGSPVLADGRLFVSVVDPGDGNAGGVVALDAQTGRRLWERREGLSTRNAVAVQEGVLVYATADGMVRAVDAASGDSRWSYDLGADLPTGSAQATAAPTIADGVVYIGVIRRFVALDLFTGVPRWEVVPGNAWLGGSLAAAGVSDGIAVAVFGRGVSGITGRSITDGAEIWNLGGELAEAISSSPVVAGGVAYFATSATWVSAVDVVTGSPLWSRRLEEGGDSWSYRIMATPALAHEQLYVPTQLGTIYSLDRLTGDTLWTYVSGRKNNTNLIHPVHYQAAAEAFAASPVVTGDLLWVGGGDGILRAIDAFDGSELWSRDLGMPIVTGVVPTRCMLFVGTWDGTMFALESSHLGRCQPARSPPTEAFPAPHLAPVIDPPAAGCGCAARGGAGDGGAALLLCLLLFLWGHRRR